MKKVLIIMLIVPLLVVGVYASALEVPTAPSEAQRYMPYQDETFAQGLIYIFLTAIRDILPDLSEAIRTGFLLIITAMTIAYISNLSSSIKRTAELIAIIFSATVLLSSAHSMIRLGTDTIHQMDDYGKLLLPIMTTALASGGAVTTSAGLYGATAIFSAAFTSVISNIFIPMLYIFIALCIANRALSDNILAGFEKFIKWLMTWLLKVILYFFTGFIAVTGVVSGSADAMTIKATKITVSGMIPVVGGIISDASEAILVGAGVMKNAAGIYGIFAFLAICISPILKITVHFMILKISAALCSLFGLPGQCGLIDDFSQAMSMILAATGSICLLLLISTVAFMKGVQ